MTENIKAFSQLSSLISLDLMGLLLLGCVVGLFFGIMPGLGGKLGIVFLIPFVFGMEPISGVVFLLAMHSVVHTSGAIPSILLGIPGTGPDAATIVDGFPMTQRGEAGRALGATLMASAVGGVIGAVFLSVLLPLASSIVLAFSPAEFFFLALLGTTFMATLSGDNLTKGLLVGLLGFALSFVGPDPLGAEPRFTFGLPYLWDGIDLVALTVAVFAIPEMIAMAAGKQDAIGVAPTVSRYGFREVWQGGVDVFRHWWLALRTSIIGALIGLVPGLGGDVASWVCYGHAVQSSKHPERFGKGEVEGVIAPETANNSKEGGALLPTIYFGIPGSSGMAILMGAFVILGIHPGPDMLTHGESLVWVMIWTLALTNILAAAILFAGTPYLATLATLNPRLMLPFVSVFSMIGIYLNAGNWRNFLVMALFSVLGYSFRKWHWPRPPLMIGLVMGPLVETSFHKAVALWGFSFIFRPLSLVMLGLALLSFLFYLRRRPKMAS
ncbi:tripartite tricarboxylate transporter permease [Aestuariivirga sp.]|uniref:tripartite tricarboxylate transporter permease n=1 Tax=Aestuariivirga sp. TaxID=2650926 RepID=UPI003783C289